MRYYYFILSCLTIKKIQNRLIDIVLCHGRDVRISKNCTAGEMYLRIKDTYVRGIKTVKTSSEMKEYYALLLEFNSDLSTILKALKSS